MTVLKNCKVIDVRKGQVNKLQVMVEGATITSIGDGRVLSDHSIDLDGGYLLPGLINCHVHLGETFPSYEVDSSESSAMHVLRCYRRGFDALQAGITTVRSMLTRHYADIDLRNMIQKGCVEGPRILSAGRSISVTGGHGSHSGSLLADGPDDFIKKAREELSSGSDHLKIFITGGIDSREEAFDESQMTIEEIEATVSVAKSKHTYVAAHAGESGPILMAVKAGVLCFEHCYFLDRDAARAIHNIGGYVCPTLCVSRSPNWMKKNRFESWKIEKALGVAQDHLESTRTAIKEGIKIITGTDIPPGDMDDGINITVREIEYLVEAGLSPLEAMQATFLNAAELMGIDNQVGVVEPCYQADFIAVRENPLKDIRALREIFFVMQSGRVVRWNKP